MADLTVREMEEWVRARWENCSSRWLPSTPNRFCVEMRYDSDMVWDQCSLQPNLSKMRLEKQRCIDSAWQAAYAFTVQREEEIRQAEENIASVSFWARTSGSSGWRKTEEVANRILAHEQERLAELKRGWRG